MDTTISTVTNIMNIFWRWLNGLWEKTVVRFFDMLPPDLSLVIYVVLYIAFCFAIVGIAATHVKAILLNYNKWKAKENSFLRYSYFRGTGQYQRVLIYKDAKKLLPDVKWLIFSPAGMAYRLRNYKPESKMKSLLASLIYFPMNIIGFFEMIPRNILGSLYLWLANIIHWGILFLLHLFAVLVTPICGIVDRGTRVEQHCSHCYQTFRIPGYVCPVCGKVHKDLVPRNTGMFFARCECGKFLPASLATGRSHLNGVCPECGKPLVATGAREIILQLIGGNTSGKTAYLAAFQHIYCVTNEGTDGTEFKLVPKEQFDELENMFMNGANVESSQTSTVAYNIVNHYPDGAKDNLVIYDVPDEVLVSGVYEQNPLNFAYTDGILIILDPTAVKSVRMECDKQGEHIAEGTYADDEAEAEDIIIEFIQQFSRLRNRSSNKMEKIPVAVIVNKSDLKAVKNQIGLGIIQSKFQSEPEKYNYNIDEARNTICRNYVIALGMLNVINNLESVFSNIQYFSISAIGHINKEGQPFEPIGVIKPLEWIVGRKNTRIAHLLQAAQNTVDGNNYEDTTVSQSLIKRYRNAKKLLLEKEFEEAEKEFRRLGNFQDSKEQAESIAEQRYNYAKELFAEKHYDIAAKHFEALNDYNDSSDCTLESWYQYGEMLFVLGNYQEAFIAYKRVGRYKGSHVKCKEIKYLIAEQKVKQGDPIGALEDYNDLGEYKDSRKKAKLLFPELIKQGKKRNLSFGNYKWRVLKVDKGMALLITETVIVQMPYHNSLEKITWKDSDIRKFLNKDFLYDFDDGEKKMIFSTKIMNEDNQEYGTDGGEDTVDAVFLLNTREMKNFFESNEDRLPQKGEFDTLWCWLRTPGGDNSYAAIVDSKGIISEGGNAVNNGKGGIRPAVWINL